MKQYFLFFLLAATIQAAVLAGGSKAVNPGTAMQAYLNNGDRTFGWELSDKQKGDGVTIYRLVLTSQKWQGIIWKHELTVIVPDLLRYHDALLFITGGSVKDGEPNVHKWNEDLIVSFSGMAKTNMTPIAILWQVPNQPLYDDLTEDALISFTLHNYLNDHDYNWPLLFPMTKSAIRAMDAVQKFSRKELHWKIRHFIVSGASKRGWTTWLTGANDKRVSAIGPMVIDVLNMPVNVDYQKVVWGDYSIEIEDYVKLGIAQQLGTPGGNDLVRMIDPYSYRKSLTMPKMIFMGTNDPYWPVDAVKNYIDSIPGDNHICYTPNAGHDLGDKRTAFAGLNALIGFTVTGSELPSCIYSIKEKDGLATLRIKADQGSLTGAALWSADSKDQDFRDEKWSMTEVKTGGSEELEVKVPIPASGFRAFYVDLRFKAPYGEEFTQSTRMYVSDSNKLLLRK